MREVHDYLFETAVEGMTAEEVLNYYRNLYHAEPQSTEHGIVAKALNDILPRMILPPCKAGDTVYWLNFYNHLMLYRDKYYEAEVVRIVVTRFGVSCVIRVRGEHATYEIPDVEFGKNVFLTREEAERALKGEHHAEIH
jgi:hypothetical protein